jgi:hypothetical protein
MDTSDPRLQALQDAVVAASNEILIGMVSTSVAELSVRYGSEVVENILTEMFMGDDYHELTAKARAEREAYIDAEEMNSHDIVSEAQAILDES